MAKRPTKKKNTSFTTWKINLENTVNADPKADGECLQIVRAYLDFMGSPDARPYRSLIDLKVATSLAENTIIQRRRKLVELGYFTVDGTTSDGATRYKIVNARENIVLDHQTIARETLRRLEAEKKEKIRQKRKNLGFSPSLHEGPLSPSRDEGLNDTCPLTPCRDSPSPHEGNYVYNTVESISMEREEPTIIDQPHSSKTYLTASLGDDQNDPLPIPQDEQEADEMMSAICYGQRVSEHLRRRLESMLKSGILTPRMVENILRPSSNTAVS